MERGDHSVQKKTQEVKLASTKWKDFNMLL